jgi:chromate transport protein ChrA
MADRAQLEAWIAETQRNQQRLRKWIAPAAIVAVALVFVSRPIGLGAILLVALVGVLGQWITQSHILDWRTRLDELDRPKPVGRALRRRESD